jgi:signal transduction histidine kinase
MLPKRRMSYSICAMTLFLLMACGQQNKPGTEPSERDTTLIRYYDDKSALFLAKEPDSAVHYAGLGLKLARRVNDIPGEALLMDRFARINEHYANYRLAERYQQGVLNLYIRLHRKADIDKAKLALSLLQAHEHNFSGAKAIATEVFNDAKKQLDTGVMVSALIKLGAINELNGSITEARDHYQQAELLQEGRPATEEYIELFSRLGKLHAGDGNHAKALTYFNKVISKSDTKVTKTHLAAVHHAGKLLDSLGDHRAALAMHRQGLQKARAAGLREEEVRALMGLAGTLKAEDSDASIRHLNNALRIAHTIGHEHLAAEIYYSLAGIYHQQSRYTEAIEALKEHHRLLDSLLDVDKAHKVAVLQSSYELAESKLKVETLELSNQQQRYQRMIGLLVTAAILVILLLLTYNFYRIRKLVHHLKRSNLIKDKLFSIIGHDLRNPIGGITQLLAVMEEDELSTEEHHRLIVEMRKQGDVTLEILNALLNWGEAQLKGIHIKPTTFNSKESISKNIDALRRQAADKGVTISDQVQEGLQVWGDQNHFEFIIRNLLSNAIKFSHANSTVDIHAQTQNEDKAVVYSVTDQGKGISAVQQQLFLRSEMDIAYGTKGEKGTGIGLMLCKEFVKANHGKLWLKSTEGKGSTFYFSFPQPGE